jgi:hypothetical protein
MRHPQLLSAAFAMILTFIAPRVALADGLTVSPSSATLRGKADRQRLIVTHTKDGKATDRTRDTRFESRTPKVVAVSADGIVTPVGDGAGIVVAKFNGMETQAKFTVVDGT